MTWIKRATAAEFIEEMGRKPDAGLLIEWIDSQLERIERDGNYGVASDVRSVIAGYWTALEYEDA